MNQRFAMPYLAACVDTTHYVVVMDDWWRTTSSLAKVYGPRKSDARRNRKSTTLIGDGCCRNNSRQCMMYDEHKETVMSYDQDAANLATLSRVQSELWAAQDALNKKDGMIAFLCGVIKGRADRPLLTGEEFQSEYRRLAGDDQSTPISQIMQGLADYANAHWHQEALPLCDAFVDTEVQSNAPVKKRSMTF